eukprot:TRINITY_DN286_c0_g2_i3.p1 TRINITY_DN286_c0_g2~~TRINITY_DN286_c0_g2_i3.p1  ORF type:complete len:260 (+),score=55.38 TRINITY_DN286_c0_g2_i3:377-1156(+)
MGCFGTEFIPRLNKSNLCTSHEKGIGQQQEGKWEACWNCRQKYFSSSSAKKKLIKKKPSPKDGKDAVEMLTSPMLRSEGEVGQVHSTCYMVISGLVAESLDTHQLLCVLQAVNKSLSSLSLETLFHVAFQSCVKIIKALDSKKPTNSDDLLVVDSLRAKAQLKLSSQKVSSGAKSTIGQCASAAAELLSAIDDCFRYKGKFDNPLCNLVLSSSLLDSPASCYTSTGILVSKMLQKLSLTDSTKEHAAIVKVATWLTDAI